MLFDPSRDQVRRFFLDVWRKTQDQVPMSPMELMAQEWMLLHPEYHGLFADEDKAMTKDFSVEDGQTNPFLHLSMHLALQEQMSIDQPPGGRDALNRLIEQADDVHEAMHHAMQCLGEMLYNAQRQSAPPDVQSYLECLQRQAG